MTSSTAPAGSASASSNAGPSGLRQLGSIVFIQGGDVWLASPDGTGARQLTHDGADSSYHDPVQTPDGSIYVLRGTDALYVLDRSSGAPRHPPVTLPVLENGAESLAVAQDGAHFAYVTTGFGQTADPRFGTPNGAFIYGGTDVATPDGASVPGSAVAGLTFPAWIDAATLAGSDGTKLYRGAIGAPMQVWLDKSNGCLTEADCPAGQDPAASVSNSAVSRDGALLAYSWKPYFGQGARIIASIAGAAASAPADRCALPGQETYSDPGSFAPDEIGFTYDDTSFDPNTLEIDAGAGDIRLCSEPERGGLRHERSAARRPRRCAT